MSSRKDTEKQPLTQNRSESSRSSGRQGLDCCLRNINTISRLCGLGVLAVMWAATVTTLRGDIDTPTYVGYYLLAASLVVTFFEVTWILDKMACCVREGCCCRCWSVILWVDGWRKFLLYTALTVPLFLQGIKGIIDIVSGFCLLVLACLYLVKSFASLRTDQEDPRPVPELQQVTVASSVRHEIATQTDAASTSTSTPEEPKDVPSNPFDEDEDDEHGEIEETKAADEKDEKGGGGGGGGGEKTEKSDPEKPVK